MNLQTENANITINGGIHNDHTFQYNSKNIISKVYDKFIKHKTDENIIDYTYYYFTEFILINKINNLVNVYEFKDYFAHGAEDVILTYVDKIDNTQTIVYKTFYNKSLSNIDNNIQRYKKLKNIFKNDVDCSKYINIFNDIIHIPSHKTMGIIYPKMDGNLLELDSQQFITVLNRLGELPKELDIMTIFHMVWISIIKKILYSIHCMHKNEFIHNDIKLENITYKIIDGDIKINLIDFGSTRNIRDDSCNGTATTYISPYNFPFDNENYCHNMHNDIWVMGLNIAYSYLNVTNKDNQNVNIMKYILNLSKLPKELDKDNKNEIFENIREYLNRSGWDKEKFMPMFINFLKSMMIDIYNGEITNILEYEKNLQQHKIFDYPIQLSKSGGKNIRKKVRNHKGIHQSGKKKGKLKKGYRYSGKKLPNGLPQIVKSKTKKKTH